MTLMMTDLTLALSYEEREFYFTLPCRGGWFGKLTMNKEGST